MQEVGIATQATHTMAHIVTIAKLTPVYSQIMFQKLVLLVVTGLGGTIEFLPVRRRGTFGL